MAEPTNPEPPVTKTDNDISETSRSQTHAQSEKCKGSLVDRPKTTQTVEKAPMDKETDVVGDFPSFGFSKPKLDWSTTGHRLDRACRVLSLYSTFGMSCSLTINGRCIDQRCNGCSKKKMNYTRNTNLLYETLSRNGRFGGRIIPLSHSHRSKVLRANTRSPINTMTRPHSPGSANVGWKTCSQLPSNAPLHHFSRGTSFVQPPPLTNISLVCSLTLFVFQHETMHSHFISMKNSSPHLFLSRHLSSSTYLSHQL